MILLCLDGLLMTENYTRIVLLKQLLLLVLSVLNTVLGQGNIYYVMQGCMICDISLHFSSFPLLVGVSNFDASQFPGNSFKNCGHITTDCCCLIGQWTTFDWLDLQNFPYKAHIYMVLVVLIIEFLLRDLQQRGLIFDSFPWSTKERVDYRTKMSFSPCWFDTHQCFSSQALAPKMQQQFQSWDACCL